MRYLIDGHNLIPHLNGLTLEMPDDEEQLVKRLQEFCRIGRHQVEVYFDAAPPEYAGPRRFGAVKAVFVRRGVSADDAIHRRLIKLGTQAKQWTVVSSDQRVYMAGREMHAAVLSSEEFAKKMEQSGKQVDRVEKPDEVVLSEEEVDMWLNMFRLKKKKIP